MQGVLRNFAGRRRLKDATEELRKRTRVAIALLSLLAINAIIAGCGGGGGDGSGVSSQVVRGVAATGAPFTGQVSLKDSSTVPKEKVSVIGSDGSFAIDVGDMTAPFILKATGTAGGASTALFSFTDQPGTANITPLSSAALASAAGVDNPALLFDDADSATRDKIKSNLPNTVATLHAKLKRLFDVYGVDMKDLIKDHFEVDHTGLDAMLDNVKIGLSNGILTITNANTGAQIFTAQLKDIEHGQFTTRLISKSSGQI